MWCRPPLSQQLAEKQRVESMVMTVVRNVLDSIEAQTIGGK